MKRTSLIVISMLILAYTTSLVTAAEGSGNRVALVIGNSDYKSTPLANPVNDATDMANTLRKLGFDVIVKTNANRMEMLNSLDLFNQKLTGSETGLFFFAGHGMQISGSNYLIPVGVHIKREGDVEFEAINAARVLAAMEDSGSNINIVILDACRDNPFKRSFRSGSRGLSIMQANRGSFISYATSPGSVASDGEGRNGIYTKHILEHITKPELTVEEVFRNVRKDVYESTGGEQLPWDSSSLMGKFYLAGSGIVVDTPSTASNSKAMLSVTSNVSGAEVRIDGSVVGKTPLSDLSVSSGSHRIQVTKSGYGTYLQTINVSAGRSASLEAHLDPSTPKTGRLYVDTTPSDARIRILDIGPAFYQGIELEPGSYTVEVSTAGYETLTRRVSLLAGEDKRVHIHLLQETTAASTHVKNSPGDNSWKIQLEKPEKMAFDMGKRYYWELVTNKGTIKIKLMPDVAPMHVSSTIYLTRKEFYNGLSFHRIIPGFMAQGGDPLGTGLGGPGYQYDGEFRSDVKYDKPYMVGMANSGSGTDGSQFFITFASTPYLNGKFTIFGQVVDGKDVLKKIEKNGSRSGKPKEAVVIMEADIIEE